MSFKAKDRIRFTRAFRATCTAGCVKELANPDLRMVVLHQNGEHYAVYFEGDARSREPIYEGDSPHVLVQHKNVIAHDAKEPA